MTCKDCIHAEVCAGYNLTRVKTAFAVGTMSLEDFEEFDENTVGDIVDYLIANGVVIREKGED